MPQRTLSELNALDVIYVRIRLYAHYELNCSVGNRVMGNYISCTVLLRYSAACVQRAVRINRDENREWKWPLVILFCISLHNCGVFIH